MSAPEVRDRMVYDIAEKNKYQTLSAPFDDQLMSCKQVSLS